MKKATEITAMLELTENLALCDVATEKCSSKNDASSNSTLCTENSSLSSVKFVKFSEGGPNIIAYVPLSSELDAEERKSIWWNRQDYHLFAETAKSISKEVRKHASLTNGLDDALRRAEQVASLVDSEDDVEQVLRRLRVDEGLSHWCTHGHSRRGLERSGSRLHAMRRKTHPTLRSDATSCFRNSKEARIFARMMGQADAVAATRQHSFMRRWSDLGSNTASPSRNSYPRTSSLPQRPTDL